MNEAPQTKEHRFVVKRQEPAIAEGAAEGQVTQQGATGMQPLSATGRWIRDNSFVPSWLPEPFSHPVAGYVLAVGLEVLATLLTLLIMSLDPNFAFPSALSILAIALAAFSWGAAPSLLATVVGIILLETFVLPLTGHGRTGHVTGVVEFVIIMAVGAIISVVASRTEQARRRAVGARAEAEARELALRETNARTDEFLSIASHELRSPLTSLKAALQMSERRLRNLAEGVAGEEQTAQVDSIISLLDTAETQVDRQNRLVGDLLDVSRIRANKLEFRFAPSDLSAIVHDAVDEQRLSWPGRDITLDAPDEAIPVRADAQRIGQVVTNYLTNALKYSPPDTPVAVSLLVQGGEARVAVRDRGPGLSAAQQQHIWDRFHRVPGVRQQSGSGAGLGLGLHITRTIVERHGGRVGIESVPRPGSTFWFTLPLSQSA